MAPTVPWTHRNCRRLLQSSRPEPDLWTPLPSLTNGGSLDAQSDPPPKSTSGSLRSPEPSKAGGGRPQGAVVHDEAPGQEGGVSANLISKIWRRKIWKHVA